MKCRYKLKIKIKKKKINSSVIILGCPKKLWLSNKSLWFTWLMVRNGYEGFWGGTGIFQIIHEILLFFSGVMLPWVLYFWVIIKINPKNNNFKRNYILSILIVITINICYLYFNLFLQYPQKIPYIEAVPIEILALQNEVPLQTESWINGPICSGLICVLCVLEICLIHAYLGGYR